MWTTALKSKRAELIPAPALSRLGGLLALTRVLTDLQPF
jgi:hypothetical protein